MGSCGGLFFDIAGGKPLAVVNKISDRCKGLFGVVLFGVVLFGDVLRDDIRRGGR
jgi:hypothetical protein